ncbi:MAG: hypothetical protein RLP44_13610 [Aggregatilineales bacterium]
MPVFQWWCLAPYLLLMGFLIWRFIFAERRKYRMRRSASFILYTLIIILAIMIVTLPIAYAIQGLFSVIVLGNVLVNGVF